MPGEVGRETLQRASVARFKVLDHLFSDRRHNLDGELQIRTSSGFLELQGIKRDGKMLTACFQAFAENYATTRNDNVVSSFAPELSDRPSARTETHPVHQL